MLLNILKCRVSKMVNTDTCPRPTAGGAGWVSGTGWDELRRAAARHGGPARGEPGAARGGRGPRRCGGDHDAFGGFGTPLQEKNGVSQSPPRKIDAECTEPLVGDVAGDVPLRGRARPRARGGHRGPRRAGAHSALNTPRAAPCEDSHQCRGRCRRRCTRSSTGCSIVLRASRSPRALCASSRSLPPLPFTLSPFPFLHALSPPFLLSFTLSSRSVYLHALSPPCTLGHARYRCVPSRSLPPPSTISSGSVRF
jgi:hypothetical protein